MDIKRIKIPDDLEEVTKVAQKGFSNTEDSNISEWFSFKVMNEMINKGRGICLKYSESNQIIGIIYAQQENPINGKEGEEKWVIVLTAVNPEHTGKKVGTQLLHFIEKEIKFSHKNAKKIFVYTNLHDEEVIHFYKKSGYQDAGYIKNYQYGENNSAIFLLKYI